MAVKDSVRAIPISGFNVAGLLPAAWQAITPAGGIPESIFTIALRNYSDRLVEVSYDGVNMHDAVLPSSDSVINLQNSSRPNGQVAQLPRGTEVYVRGLAAGAGFFYLCGYFQEAH
jgi:hypothetical protein